MRNIITLALEFLKEGKPFKVGDLMLSIEDAKYLQVTGWSQVLNFKNLNKIQSIKELQEIKNLFYEGIENSPVFKEFLSDKKIEFILCYDDYGKNSITICTEKDGIFKWQINLN